jgi:hypothetical protein
VVRNRRFGRLRLRRGTDGDRQFARQSLSDATHWAHARGGSQRCAGPSDERPFHGARVSHLPDAAEGVSSFLEKRPAHYTMRVSRDMPRFYPWWTEPGFREGEPGR